MKLVTVLAKACVYAQEHIDDPHGWDTDKGERENLLQCTSFQMACFLAQNTVNGSEGVEWEIVLDELAEHPMKTEEQWEEILNAKAEIFGRWK